MSPINFPTNRSRVLPAPSRLQGSNNMENATITRKGIPCKFFRQGRCTKNQCNFSHDSVQDLNSNKLKVWKNQNAPKKQENAIINGDGSTSVITGTHQQDDSRKRKVLEDLNVEELKYRGGVCKQVHTTATKANADISVRQDDHNSKKCKILNASQKQVPGDVEYDGLTLICKLKGHTKAINAIMQVLPYGHNKLYSASKDLTVRCWDNNTHECVGSHSSGLEVACLLSNGPWLFAGVPNSVKVKNLQNETFYELDGPRGRYNCMAFSADMLFVAAEDGKILIWRWWPKISSFEWYAVLEGHNGSVSSLIADGTKLYSGSKDCTIKVWNIETMKCLQTLHGHTKEVNSLIFWGKTLVSASMDKTLKFWGPSPTNSCTLEMVCEKKEDHGIVSLAGMRDEKNQTILLCCCDDNIVRLYDLPKFSERGRICSRDAIQVIKTGGHLIFSGDVGGKIYVWELAKA